MKRFAGLSLSFQPRSSLRVCLCFSLSHHQRSQSCSYQDYALHCSHEHGMAAPRGSVGTCNVSVSCEWDRHGRSVGQSVDAHGPIDHASVGLAQARPN